MIDERNRGNLIWNHAKAVDQDCIKTGYVSSKYWHFDILKENYDERKRADQSAEKTHD